MEWWIRYWDTLRVQGRCGICGEHSIIALRLLPETPQDGVDLIELLHERFGVSLRMDDTGQDARIFIQLCSNHHDVITGLTANNPLTEAAIIATIPPKP